MADKSTPAFVRARGHDVDVQTLSGTFAFTGESLIRYRALIKI